MRLNASPLVDVGPVILAVDEAVERNGEPAFGLDLATRNWTADRPRAASGIESAGSPPAPRGFEIAGAVPTRGRLREPPLSGRPILPPARHQAEARHERNGMAAITSQNLATAMLKLVAVDALPALSDALLVANLVRRDFEPEVVQQGDTVTVTVPSPQHDKTVCIDQYVEATFQIPDVTKVIAVPDLLRLYMQAAIDDIAAHVEERVMACAIKFSGSPLSSQVFGVDLVNAADTRLFEQGVADGIEKFLVTSPAVYAGLRCFNGFSEYQTATDAGLRRNVCGSVGKIRQFYALRSRHLAASDGIAFSRDAIILAFRRLPKPLPGSCELAEYSEIGNLGLRVSTTYSPNTLTQQYTIAVLFGADVLVASHGIELLAK